MVILRSGSITGSQEQLQNHVQSSLELSLLRRRSQSSPKGENGLYGNLRYDEIQISRRKKYVAITY